MLYFTIQITQHRVKNNPKESYSYEISLVLLGSLIRHRACELRDVCQFHINAELDMEFELLCQQVAEARKQRGLSLKMKKNSDGFNYLHFL